MRKQTKFHIDGCEKKAEFFIYLGKNYKKIFQEMGKVISLLRFYRESENLYILEYRLTIEDSVGVIKLKQGDVAFIFNEIYITIIDDKFIVFF